MSASSKLLTKLPFRTHVAENIHAPVGKWVLATGGMVVGMITVGGITRMTKSGLSMTSWKPLGTLPPLTQAEWDAEFERYKQFPEWQQRQSMTLSEFKYIYGWEYGHRMLGRLVGVGFVLPWAYFSFKGKIPQGHQKRMVALAAMGGGQGLVGWWMVKSGLGEDRRGDKREIRVKPFNLTAHLTMAFVTYGALLWTGFDLLAVNQENKVRNVAEQVIKLGKEAVKHTSRLRAGAIFFTGLSGITVVSGALVAGNDAGLAYNTYPKMGDQWVPDEIMELEPWHRNFVENTAMVQFNHRVLATAVSGAAIALMAAGLGKNPTALTPQAQKALYAVGASVTGQVTLGIVTLLNYVPITLAVAHQLGSVVVFTSGVYLTHALRYARPAMLRRPAAIMTSSNIGRAAVRPN